ncbi:UDP-N-acetylmuramoyl-tripeptide--D-alanyl-D-alanine ligase [Bacillus spongiae]|uniref:UDP-N-acetylmuramoyl-tripeptide--D-alanyl-D-alanine ligase n=1 Tax=Bacillus spongiae TaxID=2683610 RepID=A0ABU8HJP7_9BACI
MIKRTLKQIENMITVQNDLSTFSSLEIEGVCIDSRRIEKGNLFIPFKGERMDGHEFVHQAIEDGASAALWEKSAGEPPANLPIIVVDNSLQALQDLARSYRQQLNAKVVGITGSNGKTTTKDIAASLLSLQYKVQKTEGNYNSHIGLPLTILGMEENTEVMVLEMGMSGKGEIAELTHIASPEVVVITNIGESHLQDLGSREGIAQAKLEIIEGLTESGLLVYFGEEPLLVERIRSLSIRAETFGKEKGNTIFPTSLEANQKGTFFSTNITKNQSFFLPILGEHNVLNTMAAMLVAKELDVHLEQAQQALDNVRLTGMRLETVKGAKGETIINDAYNASPTSTRAAIDLLASLKGYHQKVLVLGDMLELGTEEEAFHTEIGNYIPLEEIDYVMTYGPLAEKLAEAANMRGHGKVFSFQNKEELVQRMKETIQFGDVVLFKASRGMKLEEVVEKLM